MQKKIRGRKQMMEFVAEARSMVERYGWQERTVHPYRFPMKVTRVLDECAAWDECTKGSQEYLESLASGLARILSAWERNRGAV